MELYKRHNEWLNMARYLGGEEDDVQEMYILLITMDKLDVNTSYIYLTLRSIIFRRKSNNPRQDTAHYKYHEAQGEDRDYIEAENIVYKNIDNVLDSIHWYDARLYKVYRDSGKSCRKLAKETGIGWMSIFNTIRNVKNIIREEVQEDYIDLKNRDYERIKEKSY